MTSPLLLTVAMASADELQLAEALRFCVLWSEKIPVAVSCRALPWAMERFVGMTTIEISTAGVTVTAVVPDTPAKVALTVALPLHFPLPDLGWGWCC